MEAELTWVGQQDDLGRRVRLEEKGEEGQDGGGRGQGRGEEGQEQQVLVVRGCASRCSDGRRLA